MPQRLVPLPHLHEIEDMLKHWEKKSRSEATQCSCIKCSSECKKTPGIYSPQQVRDQFETHGPSAFDNMTQDYRIYDIDGEERVIFYLTPSMIEDEKAGATGGRRDGMYMGTCVHLGPEGCTLDRDKMPLGCILALPCERPQTEKYKANLQNQGVMWMTEFGVQTMLLFEKHQRKAGIDQDLAMTARSLRFLQKSREHMRAHKLSNNNEQEYKSAPYLETEFTLLHMQLGEETMSATLKDVVANPQAAKDYLKSMTRESVLANPQCAQDFKAFTNSI